jgi:phosphohistidine phosphatase SixA
MFDVEDPPLTEAGLKRAKAWGGILEKAGIKAVYTSKKRRTKQTGESIAQALNIPLESVSRKEVTRLVDKIRVQNAGDRVLIVTHSRQMPKIFKELGLSSEDAEKVTFSKDEYGNLFVFVPEGEDGGMVLQLRY